MVVFLGRRVVGVLLPLLLLFHSLPFVLRDRPRLWKNEFLKKDFLTTKMNFCCKEDGK